jgi:tetratricopeptide (TPR) repeat protein
MYTKKKQNAALWVLGGLGMILLLGGCSPSGPNALLAGKRLLDRGQPGLAVRQLREAVSLMPTNGTAWGYLGVAYHLSGNRSNAVFAYTQALSHKPDLGEVRFNLGCLWMEQGQWAQAREQFAAATVMDKNSAQAWRWLGEAEMRMGEPAKAVRCLGESLRLDAQSADAWNWLGLAQLQQGRLQEAERSFQSALRVQANHGPSILNLAILNQEKLRNPARAIELYRQYLAYFPLADNTLEVRAVLAGLEQVPKPVSKPVEVVQAPVRSSPPAAGASETNPPGSGVVVQTNRVVRAGPAKPVPPVSPPAPERQAPVREAAVEPRSVAARPPIAAPAESRDRKQPSGTTVGEQPVTSEADNPASDLPVTSEPQKRRGFFAKINPLNLFKKGKREQQTTPLPKRSDNQLEPVPTVDASESEREPVRPRKAPSQVELANADRFNRYGYRLSGRPQPGDRQAAERDFMEAETLRRRGERTKAQQAYALAVKADPSHFAAQFNLGLISLEEGDLPRALAAFEAATRIRPDSTAARYNFSLALKSANYPVDSANELLVLLAYDDEDPRAHLILGNLYAQQFGNTSKAREHYLRVLELDPQNSQAGAIRFWLVEKPQ